MNITIELDDASASQLLQDAAIAKGYQGLSDDEAYAMASNDLAGILKDWCKVGRLKRAEMDAEKAASDDVAAKVRVDVSAKGILSTVLNGA